MFRVTVRRGCREERREARAQWAQPPKAVSAPEFRQTTSGTHGSANRADCLPRGKPPACSNRQQLCRKNFPFDEGLTRRLRREGRACSPMGRSMLQVAVRRGAGGNGGKRVSSGYNRRRRLAPGRSGKQQAERTVVRAAPIVCPKESPCVFSPTTARRGCRGGERKAPC